MEQDELLRHAARCFDEHGIRYFVTGAVAAIAYGAEMARERFVDIPAPTAA